MGVINMDYEKTRKEYYDLSKSLKDQNRFLIKILKYRKEKESFESLKCVFKDRIKVQEDLIRNINLELLLWELPLNVFQDVSIELRRWLGSVVKHAILRC